MIWFYLVFRARWRNTERTSEFPLELKRKLRKGNAYDGQDTTPPIIFTQPIRVGIGACDVSSL